MHIGHFYLMKVGPGLAPVVFIELRHRLNVAALEKLAARATGLDEVASSHIPKASAPSRHCERAEKVGRGGDLMSQTRAVTLRREPAKPGRPRRRRRDWRRG